VETHPAQLAALDAEIVRLGNARWAADEFDREYARAEIDRLLEQRHALTGPVEPPAG
jgi:hypothetical protein